MFRVSNSSPVRVTLSEIATFSTRVIESKYLDMTVVSAMSDICAMLLLEFIRLFHRLETFSRTNYETGGSIYLAMALINN